VSRPDRSIVVGVDFAPPRARKRAHPLALLAVMVLVAGVAALAVTQLLLR
jgi:hypothetical protein